MFSEYHILNFATVTLSGQEDKICNFSLYALNYSKNVCIYRYLSGDQLLVGLL